MDLIGYIMSAPPAIRSLLLRRAEMRESLAMIDRERAANRVPRSRSFYRREIRNAMRSDLIARLNPVL